MEGTHLVPICPTPNGGPQIENPRPECRSNESLLYTHSMVPRAFVAMHSNNALVLFLSPHLSFKFIFEIPWNLFCHPLTSLLDIASARLVRTRIFDYFIRIGLSRKSDAVGNTSEITPYCTASRYNDNGAQKCLRRYKNRKKKKGGQA
jgi:hypothetical protein